MSKHSKSKTTFSDTTITSRAAPKHPTHSAKGRVNLTAQEMRGAQIVSDYNLGKPRAKGGIIPVIK